MKRNEICSSKANYTMCPSCVSTNRSWCPNKTLEKLSDTCFNSKVRRIFVYVLKMLKITLHDFEALFWINSVNF